MAEKIKINDYGDCIFSDDEIIEQIYQNPKLEISNLLIENSDQYNRAIDILSLDFKKIQSAIHRSETIADFDKLNQDQWNMPEYYYKINVLEWLLERCQTDQERLRVKQEYELFEKKQFIKVLQFLIYFIDTLREKNIVWGVGRGSSVSSFCLFLIGVHKINPLLYDLDYKEFLR